MKKFVMFAIVALVAVACSKDQRAVKKLDGTWKATNWTASIGGITIDLLSQGGSISYTFESCKIKDGDFCNASSSIVFPDNDPINWSGLYTVSGGGTVLEQKEDLSSVTIDKTTITDLTSKILKVERADENELGEFVSKITLEKQ